jgi:hypothetical protein
MHQAIPAVAANETFDRTWPFRSHYTNSPGFRTHYVVEDFPLGRHCAKNP